MQNVALPVDNKSSSLNNSHHCTHNVLLGLRGRPVPAVFSFRGKSGLQRNQFEVTSANIRRRYLEGGCERSGRAFSLSHLSRLFPKRFGSPWANVRSFFSF